MHLQCIYIILLVSILKPSWTADVLAAPSVIHGGGSRTVLEGDRKDLICIFSGIPGPVVTWKKDNVIVRSAKREFNSFYKITDATASDAGVYECEGVNSQGTASATYIITVEPREQTTSSQAISTTTRSNGGGTNIKGTREPQTTPASLTIETNIIMRQPYYNEGTPNLVVYVQRGSTVQLDCSVTTNAAQHTVNWYRGSAIVQTGRYTYRKENFGSNDAGRYKCIAHSNNIVDSSIIDIKVCSVVRITSSPRTRYYALKEVVSLRVELSPQNDCILNWYRIEGSSSRLMRQGDGVYFQSNNKRMDINPLVEKYIGAYKVVVRCCLVNHPIHFSINVYAVIRTEQPRGTTPFIEGSTIHLPCEYYGYPPPVVKWYLNDEELNPSNSNKYNLSSDNVLRVGPLGASDNGNRIECRVTQNDLRRDIEYTLEMGRQPEIVTTKCKANLCVNSNVKLVCKAESESALSYRWYKSPVYSSSLTTSPKYNVYSYGRLDILNPNSNDIGTYVCEARNKFGAVYIGCQVKDPVELKLVSREQNILLTLGRNANLHCVVNGSLGATVSWYKDDNRALPSDAEINKKTGGQITYSVLSFPSVTIQHAGKYTCTMSSCDSEVRLTHQLRVRQNVEITRTPTKVYFCSGSTVAFPCAAIGFPPPEINWYFNDEIITNGEDGFQIDERNTLSIIDGPAIKTGYYTCNASNPFSWRTYRFRAFFQDTTLPTFETTSLSLPVLNQDFCLNCLPTISGVEYTYRWYKRYTVLYNTAKFNQSNAWQLCITNFNLQDIGTYSCRVTNCIGPSRKTFSINSYQGQDVAPSISTTRAEYNVIQDRTVRLFCKATGSPDPSISWYYEGELVGEEGHFSLAELPNLRIDNVQRSLHSGSYECRASNRVGTDKLTIQMIVYQTPKLISIRSQRVEVGLTACSNCSLIQGYPVPTKVWTKNGIAVVSQGRVIIDENTLCISRVIGDDQGVYRCTATNRVGWAYVEATLQVRTCGLLKFEAIQLNHVVVDGNNLEINCPIQPNFFECSMVVNWYELTHGTNGVKKRIPSSDPRLIGDSLTLQLNMNGAGFYQCEAYNQYSTIVQNHIVKVVAPPWVVPYEEQQLFKVNSEVRLNCPVRGTPALTYIWLLEGRELDSGENLIIDNEQLTIINASTVDIFHYFCKGSNLYGQREARFEITICGSMTLELTEDHEVTEKTRTSFICYLQGNIVATSIVFLVGDLTLAELPAKRFTYTQLEDNRAELRISPRVEDTGRIACRVSTPCGTSEIIRLLIVRPKQRDGLRVVRNQVTHPGTVLPNCHNQFTLKCPVRGKPKPAYEWFHNNAKIAFNAHIVSARGKKEITVHDPDINDAGNYRCNATNNQGRVSYTYIISVRLPRANSIYQTHVVFEEADLNLTCKPDVLANRKWSKDLVRLNGVNFGDSNDLVINGVQSSDEGVYLCCAKSGDDIYRYVHQVNVQE